MTKSDALRIRREGQARGGRKQPQALNAAACGGDDFNAQAEGLERDHLAGFGDAARDLADQAAEGCGFPGFVEIDRFADEVAELIGGKAAGNEP